MYLPNYKNGSIVNLTASILNSTGKPLKYSPLKLLPADKLKNKNIVLIILDGLGYEFIKKYKKSSFLGKNLLGKMTSVFPPTTAAAITTFLTGKAPGEHGVTGWFVYLKELDLISTILPFSERGTENSLSDFGTNTEEIFGQKSIFQNIDRKSFAVTSSSIADSDYTRYFSENAQIIPYANKSLPDFISTIKKTINSSTSEKFIYAYWSKFDSLSHEFGIEGEETKRHFKNLDKKLEGFITSCQQRDTTFLITADHGLIDTIPERTIYLNDHPEFENFLSMPLSGEPRASFCFLKDGMEKEFIAYHKKHLKKYSTLIKSTDLIKKNAFGLFNHNEKLLSRLGDYILLMKDNYALKDFIAGEDEYYHTGNHGGVSKEEMFVPLIYKNLTRK